jgi:hypothetical protein
LPNTDAKVSEKGALYLRRNGRLLRRLGESCILNVASCRVQPQEGRALGINFAVGWIAILAGLVAGAVIGMFFHGETWLGGYSSWQRRMLRLTHISMVGTGLLNLAFALSAAALHLDPVPRLGSALLVVGAVTMPLVCAASAWRPAARHLFFIPVVSLILATLDIIYWGMFR